MEKYTVKEQEKYFRELFILEHLNEDVISSITEKGKNEILIIFNSSLKFDEELPLSGFGKKGRKDHPDLQENGMIGRKSIPAVVTSTDEDGMLDMRKLHSHYLDGMNFTKNLRFYDIDVKNKTLVDINPNERVQLFADKVLDYISNGVESCLSHDCHNFREFVAGNNPSLKMPLKYYSGKYDYGLQPGLLLSFSRKITQKGGNLVPNFKFTHSGISITDSVVLAKQNSGSLYMQHIDDVMHFRRTPNIFFQLPDLEDYMSYVNLSKNRKRKIKRKLSAMYS